MPEKRQRKRTETKALSFLHKALNPLFIWFIRDLLPIVFPCLSSRFLLTGFSLDGDFFCGHVDPDQPAVSDDLDDSVLKVAFAH